MIYENAPRYKTLTQQSVPGGHTHLHLHTHSAHDTITVIVNFLAVASEEKRRSALYSLKPTAPSEDLLRFGKAPTNVCTSV